MSDAVAPMRFVLLGDPVEHSRSPAIHRAALAALGLTGSYASPSGYNGLAGTAESEAAAFSSACHGAVRAMSRHQARKHWQGRALTDQLAERGIVVKSPSFRGIAEEAPGAYKDVSVVIDATEQAGLARKVARLTPHIVIKG